jgi:hypothetical protein
MKYIERLLIHSKTRLDLTSKGKQEKDLEISTSIFNSLKYIPAYQIMFNTRANRMNIHKYCLWIMDLLNFIEKKHGKAVYFMPEPLVEISFEIFRIIKRDNIPVYETAEEIANYKSEYD